MLAKTLAGRRVLVTRAPQDAGALRGLLEARGATVLELPAVAIEPPEDTERLDYALGRLAEYDWIVFTSRNAVRAVFERLSALEASPAFPQVAAVGPATAAELEARDIGVNCLPTEATGEALAAAMRGLGMQGVQVFLPAGNLSRPLVRQELEDAGARVDEIVAYRTLRPADVEPSSLQAVRRGEIDAIAFLSPSAVRNLADMVGPDLRALHGVDLVCIGPTTAAAVRELGLQPAAVAETHTLGGLVETLANMYGESA